jgi:hypothetical protein
LNWSPKNKGSKLSVDRRAGFGRWDGYEWMDDGGKSCFIGMLSPVKKHKRNMEGVELGLVQLSVNGMVSLADNQHAITV